MANLIKIETREQLLSTLSEAAELEHNLMCLYLYALFSLKEKTEDGVNEEELRAIQGWAKVIKEIAIQEMSHLAIVANLTTVIGGTAHFHRPSFPVTPGYYPSDFVVELAPFDMGSLDHFIFLERPEDAEVPRSEDFIPEVEEAREAPKGRLMSHTGDYGTVGELYSAIKNGFRRLSKTIGEKDLFCGHQSLQLTKKEMKMEGLFLISNYESAERAIAVVVEQGEGGASEDSHFQKFVNIKKEYEDLLKKNPGFRPSRDVVRNPVMRKPLTGQNNVWINHSAASEFLDLSNALYSLMLRILTQVYAMENREQTTKNFLLESAFNVMGSISHVSRLLTNFPATSEGPQKAGMSFSLDRHFTAYELSCERQLLGERSEQILQQIENLKKKHGHAEELEAVGTKLMKLSHKLKTSP